MERARTAGLLAASVLLAHAGSAHAQFDVRWAEFRNDTTARLVASPDLGASDVEEKDYAWGDLDRDGDVDLVVVRKQPGTTAGRKPNVLLMNEGGTLVDRTALYAAAADVAGDQGFLTATNDRDVVVADLDGDGWLDVATAVTISDGLPKEVSHPRIYRNLGSASDGSWRGLRFEAGRSPQLYMMNADGTADTSRPQPGRFCAIAAGDLDSDGDLDLYLGDYDSSGGGGLAEPPGTDLDDRVWLNDGNGFFTDSLRSRFSATMLASAFAMSAVIADVNGDGVNELVKDTALNSPFIYIGIAYDTPPYDGVFDIFDKPHALSPYFISMDDLNNDGRLDMVVTDDNTDRYRLNTGNDVLGRATWTAALPVRFPTGASYIDDGFGGQSVIVDIDRDGWKDVVITDADVDGFTCNRRTHVYRNLGDAPNVTLREEAETSTPAGGWKGAVGLQVADLQGTYNVAAFDRDNDGDDDLVLGRCAGTSLWTNQLCHVDRFGAPSPNSTGQPARLSWRGTARVGENDFVVRATGLPPNATGTLTTSWGKARTCVPDGNGLRCLDADARRYDLPVTANAQGVAEVRLDFTVREMTGFQAGSLRYLQLRYQDPAAGRGAWNWTDALDVKACP